MELKEAYEVIKKEWHAAERKVNVDLDIVYETLKYDIPELLEQLDK